MNIYIGWDSRESLVYDVCEFSIRKYNNSIPITPIKLNSLHEYTRPIDPLSSTEFTFSRFFVPYLNAYKGWALFMDCDFLWQVDVNEIFELADPSKAIMCVKHDYKPSNTVKMDGQSQHIYPRKNWSSLMLFNCEHPANQALNLHTLNEESGAFLHRFQWLSDDLIGELPHVYNWLEGWYNSPRDGFPKAIHYTNGGPYFRNYTSVDFAENWLSMFTEMTNRPFMDSDFLD